MSLVYSWHATTFTHLTRDRSRLPHAILLHGQVGTGKLAFAMQLSQALLCRSPLAGGTACGDCASCRWFATSAHPDFKVLAPVQESESEDGASSIKKTKKKANISVAQIRELSEFLNLSSHQAGGFKVVVLHPAESLNAASANALLKMLEEPSSDVVFILVTHQIQRLLPTILSRCQKIAMPTPTLSETLVWLDAHHVIDAKEKLAYFDGSPIKALEAQGHYAQLPSVWRLLAQGKQLTAATTAQALMVSFANSHGNPIENSMIALQKWLYDIVHVQCVGQPRYHLQEINALQRLAENVHLNALFNLQTKLLKLRQLASHPLNHELQLEALLQDYTKIFDK